MVPKNNIQIGIGIILILGVVFVLIFYWYVPRQKKGVVYPTDTPTTTSESEKEFSVSPVSSQENAGVEEVINEKEDTSISEPSLVAEPIEETDEKPFENVEDREPEEIPTVYCAYSKKREFTIDIFSNTDWRPASLVVCDGDTVTLLNQDNDLHWPGADPHPTHSSLPGYDALGGISQGQSYSHTFRTVGVFGHHEHLIDNPPTVGTITVLPRIVPPTSP